MRQNFVRDVFNTYWKFEEKLQTLRVIGVVLVIWISCLLRTELAWIILFMKFWWGSWESCGGSGKLEKARCSSYKDLVDKHNCIAEIDCVEEINHWKLRTSLKAVNSVARDFRLENEIQHSDRFWIHKKQCNKQNRLNNYRMYIHRSPSYFILPTISKRQMSFHHW